jgi:hypothetical protein
MERELGLNSSSLWQVLIVEVCKHENKTFGSVTVGNPWTVDSY